MALKKFRTAEQDQWGRFWAVNEDGSRIPVQPYSDEDFSGYRQIDTGSGDEGGGSSIANAPAGLSPDAWRLQSGDVLPPEMIAQAVQALNTPGFYAGVDGMTMDQYLADPRAAVNVENGQFVYRPEQMQGDFESINRESFLQAAMPFFAATLPFVAGPLAASMGLFAPAAGAASAASSAAPAATSAAVDAFLNTAPMTFGQAAAPSLLSTGALASTPVSALSGLSSLLPAGGAQALMAGTGLAMASPLTGLPMAIDAAGNTLMQQIGGLAPELATMTPTSAIPATGSFSQTIELPAQTNAFEAPVDFAPQTPGADGIDWSSDIFDPSAPSTFNGNPADGWNVANSVSPTMPMPTPAPDITQAPAPVEARTTPGPVPGSTRFPSGVLTPAGLGNALSAGSLLSRLVGGNATTQDWTQLLGTIGQGALGYLGSRQQTDALSNLQNQMTQQRAPFLNTATGFLNNPDSFYTSPQATGAANAVLRQLSATHGNPAGSPTAQSLATGALYDRYLNTVNSLGSLGLSGQGIQSNLGQQIAQTSGQPFAIAGDVIGSMTSDNSMQQMLRRMMQQNQFSLA